MSAAQARVSKRDEQVSELRELLNYLGIDDELIDEGSDEFVAALKWWKATALSYWQSGYDAGCDDTRMRRGY